MAQGYGVLESTKPEPAAEESPAIVPGIVSAPVPNTSAAVQAPFDHLPLRDCDFFTHAFDEMLRKAGQGDTSLILSSSSHTHTGRAGA